MKPQEQSEQARELARYILSVKETFNEWGMFFPPHTEWTEIKARAKNILSSRPKPKKILGTAWAKERK